MKRQAVFSSIARLSIGLAAVALLLIAHADDVIGPQWLTTFSRQVLANDSAPNAKLRPWDQYSNGDILLASYAGDYPSSLLIRRLAPDGSSRYVRVESAADITSVSDIGVKIDNEGGAYIAFGDSRGCNILHLNSVNRRDWLVPSGAGGGGNCRAMEVLPDGSALALQGGALTRFSTAGQVVWTTWVDSGAQDFAVDGNNMVWIASRAFNQAAVVRLTLAGARVSVDTFLCDDCIASYGLSVNILPDGKAVVGGGSGSGQPGFFAVYDPDGTRRVLTVTEPDIGYDQVQHDAAGAVYARANRLSGGLAEIRRIDPLTGAVLWVRAGQEFITISNGIVITNDTGHATEARAYDRGGNPVWTRALPSVAAGYGGPGLYVDGNVTFLTQGSATECGSAPRLVSVDAAGGSIANTVQACGMPDRNYDFNYDFESFDALVGVGALANFRNRIVALTPEGTRRWQTVACSWCISYSYEFSMGAQWGDAVLTGDGGAWAIGGQNPGHYAPAVVATLNHIGAHGETLQALTLGSTSRLTRSRVVRSGSSGAVVLLPGQTDLVWQRYRVDGSLSEVHSYSVASGSWLINIAAISHVADGGLLVVVTNTASDVCFDACPPVYGTLLRLAADGTELWRSALPVDHYGRGNYTYGDLVALSTDGSAVAVYNDSSDRLPYIYRINLDGRAEAPIMLSSIPTTAILAQLRGPIRNQFLLSTEEEAVEGGGSTWSQKLRLLNTDGDVLAVRTIPILESGERRVVANGEYGYLWSHHHSGASDTELLDPVGLNSLGRFELDGSSSAGVFNRLGLWRLLEDGSIYGAKTVPAGEGSFLQTPRFGRFAVPASPAWDLIFRDGNEQAD